MVKGLATLDEARSADEVFDTSTTREIGWVGQWDSRAVISCSELTAV